LEEAYLKKCEEEDREEYLRKCQEEDREEYLRKCQEEEYLQKCEEEYLQKCKEEDRREYLHKQHHTTVGPNEEIDQEVLFDNLADAKRRAKLAREEAQRLIGEDREWQRVKSDMRERMEDIRAEPERVFFEPAPPNEEEFWAQQAVEEEAARRAHQEEWERARAEAKERARQWQEEAYEKMAKDEEDRRSKWEEWMKQYAVPQAGPSEEETMAHIADHEEKWADFEINSPTKIRKQDVPFPTDNTIRQMAKMAFLGVKEEGSPVKDFKTLVKRWHPDKFLQKFGKKLEEQEKDSILDKVKEIFQLVQEEKQQRNETHE